MREPKQLRRVDLESAVAAVVRRGRAPWQPDVCEVRFEGQALVWKDMGRRPALVRWLMRPVLRREARAMAALDGLRSAPRLVGVVDGGMGIVMEKLDAARLPHLKDNDLTPAFFDALLAELRAMHDAGVTHGDLRRMNVLIENAPERRPRLIDFGTAIVLGPRPSALQRTLWRKARRIDLLHYAKLKEHYLPGSLTAAERRWLGHAPWYYRLGRLYRAYVHRPLKRRNLRKALARWMKR
ncbi:MAG: hypothetical protein NTW86_28520 [Candidatus Sumerlaeota bacterium]|nr:hypothetical protein [Candidatus Sumerlaeota bacterium]